MAKRTRHYTPPRFVSGWDRFNDYYAEVYGQRWYTLRAALEEPVNHVAMLNPWADVPEDVLARARPSDGLPGCVEMPGQELFPSPETLELELFPYYLLDGASVMAPLALDVQPGDDVLDLCAAPGGKTFALARQLDEAGTLTTNDVDDRRRLRLKRTVDKYLPPRVRDRVRVTGEDATRWSAIEQEAYDRVLVDAPCSSERHLLRHGSGLDMWSTARSDDFSRTQYAMLSGAVDVVRPGGRIVYSTCSISPLENDEVVARLLQRRGDQVELAAPGLTWGEPTAYGWQVLPDVTPWGPLYICALRRRVEG